MQPRKQKYAADFAVRVVAQTLRDSIIETSFLREYAVRVAAIPNGGTISSRREITSRPRRSQAGTATSEARYADDL